MSRYTFWVPTTTQRNSDRYSNGGLPFPSSEAQRVPPDEGVRGSMIIAGYCRCV